MEGEKVNAKLEQLDPVTREALGVLAAAIKRLEEAQEKLATENQELKTLFNQALDEIKKRDETHVATLAQMRQLIQETKNKFTITPPTGGRTHNA